MAQTAVIYEVNLSVNKEIDDQYKSWLEVHIKDILKLDGFIRAEWFARNPEDEGQPADDSKSYYTIHYHLSDRASLDKYFKEHAPAFREDGIKRFGGKFTAQRRVLTLHKQLQADILGCTNL